MISLESVVDAVNLRVLDLQPNETADLVLIQELNRAGIDQEELGMGFYDDDTDDCRWTYVGLTQYASTGRLSLVKG